ncbi:MAG: trypsin-like serine protease [Gemmatimonadaceae bacterium]
MKRLACLVFVVGTLVGCKGTDVTTGPTTPTSPRFITGNFAGDNVHTWVGLIAFYDASGEFIGRCSGSLISPTKFLTAGHCVEDASSARIWFAQDAGANYNPLTQFDPVTGYPDTCLPQPAPCVTSHQLFSYGYPGGFPDSHDVGLAILDEPVTTVGFGELASVGTLSSLATKRGQQDVTFLVSGYGLSQIVPTVLSFRSRLMAQVQFVNLTSALTDGFNVQTVESPGRGKGGTCFGDSGGPLLYNEKIVAVTSFGLNNNCKGVGFFYTVDRAGPQNWIANPN